MKSTRKPARRHEVKLTEIQMLFLVSFWLVCERLWCSVGMPVHACVSPGDVGHDEALPRHAHVGAVSPGEWLIVLK